MQRRNQKNKRASNVRGQRGGLVYKRTEIDTPTSDFNMTKIYYGLILITMVGMVYLVFFSGTFTVSEVAVKGTKDIDPKNIQTVLEEKMNNQLFKKNIFLFDKDSASRELKKKYALKTLKIKKQYPNKIDVVLDEYASEVQWFSGNKYYLIDEKGKAVAEQQAKKENIPVVEDKKSLPVQVGKSLVTVDFINFIKYLDKNFSQVRNSKITKIEINESFNEVFVYSSLGPYIIFDTTRDPEQEIKNLVTAVESTEMAKKKLTYIDMRIKSKIYYK